jgi:hypothetical protein
MFAAQRDFAHALIDADRPVPVGVTAHTGERPARRFAVYRNNVVVSLVEALRVRFPATERIVGDEFFAAMARVYATTEPPRSPLMMTYGDGFADFVAAFPPAADLPYLADVARLEAARTRAYHAADATPVGAERLAAVAADVLELARFTLHPSVEIVRSAFPVVTIWAMNAGETEPGTIDDWSGEDALVSRPDLEVLVRALPAGGAAFLDALKAGAPLPAAAAAARAASADFDLVANLAGVLAARIVVRIDIA